MKLLASIFSVLVLGLIGYTVGYLSGAVTGIAIYYKRAQDEDRKNQVLEELDLFTPWDLSDTE